MDFDGLILEAMPRAKHLAMSCSGLDRDDAVSIAYLTLVKIASRFDPARGCIFWTFAEPNIRGALKDAMRSSSGYGGGRGMRFDTVYLDAPSIDGMPRPDVAGKAPDESMIAARIDVLRRLPSLRKAPKALLVVKMMLSGWDDSQIRDFTGANVNQLGALKFHSIRRIREELKRAAPAAAAKERRGYTVNGVTLPLLQWAKLRRINHQTVMNRLRGGMAIEEALAPPRHGPMWVPLTIDGATHPLSTWAAIHGVGYNTAWRRLRLGATPLEAVQAGRQKRKHKAIGAHA